MIRPGVFLYGEMLDNTVMTRAMDEVSKADILLVCGSSFNGLTCSNCIRYFDGDKAVVINNEPHYSDKKADFVIYGEVGKILTQLVGT